LANARNLRGALLVAALTLCAACSAKPTPLPKPSATVPLTTNVPLSTHIGPIVRETLPSTWTEMPTPSPTLTPTATPVTPTARPTAIPALADLCATFTVNYQFPDNLTFHWNNAIVMTLGTPLMTVLDPATNKPVALTVRFLAVNLLNQQNQGAQLYGGLVAIMELPISALPGPGLYHWTAAVYGDGIGQRCTQQGYFVVLRTAEDIMTATAFASITPTVTPTMTLATDEATEEGTIIPIFQGNIPIPAGGS